MSQDTFQQIFPRWSSCLSGQSGSTQEARVPAWENWSLLPSLARADACVYGIAEALRQTCPGLGAGQDHTKTQMILTFDDIL